MNGVVPVWAFMVKASYEQPVCLNHDLRVGGLHREAEIMVVMIPGDAGELEGALNHAEWSVTVAVHDPV